MRQHSFATRSIRRRPRAPSRLGSRAAEQAALQIFVFRGETFLGTELFDGSRPIMAGRHHDTQLRLDGETVSRYHVRLSVIGRDVFVEDLDSGNGTLVNRKRIEARTRIEATDQVRIGAYTLRIKLLTAPGPRPYDPSKSEDTTKINAILAAERIAGETSEVEVGVDDSQPSLNEALYKEALRRTTGGSSPQPLPAAPAAAPQGELEDDSTQMPAEGLMGSASVPAPVVIDNEDDVEARLRDLDALIATLEAEDRAASQAPFGKENTAPTTTELDVEDALFNAASQSRPVDTREFARDLASRLALNGQLVEPKAKAKVIPLRPETRPPTPIPQEPFDEDEDPTEAELADERLVKAATPAATQPQVDLDPALLAAAALDDDGPETDLLAGGIPPQLAPQILEPSRATPMPPRPASAVRERAVDVRDPAASGPSPVPAKGLSFPGRRPAAPAPARPSVPAPVPQAPADVAPTAPAPRKPAAKRQNRAQDRAAPVPPPLPKKRRRHHEARLMTPTSLRVDVTPMHKSEDSRLLADVFSESERSRVAPSPAARRSPPPLPKRSATEARPKAKMDGFSEAVRRLPDEPIPMHWDGVEVAARVNGQLIDIAVLRKPKEEYILGHRTPQGAIAPARANLGLRLVRINDDSSVDLVFPSEVGGHLMRGSTTAMFSDLAEGRKYSSLRLEQQDIATIVLGTGKDTISYHVRFLRRPKSLFRSLRGLRS